MATSLKAGLLKTLFENRNRYVSGQEISEKYKCSRTAIWKYIEELRTEGFEIDSQRKSGYKLEKEPNVLFPHVIDARLKTEKIGRNIHYYEQLPSTQTVASTLSVEGVEEGTLVIAEEQLAGKGRLSRQWQSPKGTGIWMSMILRPTISIQKTPQLTLLTAVAVASTITEYTGVQADIKWPNDILIHGKKVVGILTELQAEADRVNSVIVGIGFNVNQVDFPPEINDIATSLRLEKEEIHRPDFLAAFLGKFETLYNQYLDVGFFPIKLMWESYAISIGRQVHARTLNGTISGMAMGIDEDGVLLIKDEQGVVHHVYSADIELA